MKRRRMYLIAAGALAATTGLGVATAAPEPRTTPAAGVRQVPAPASLPPGSPLVGPPRAVVPAHAATRAAVGGKSVETGHDDTRDPALGGGRP